MKPSDDNFLCEKIAADKSIAGFERLIDLPLRQQQNIRLDGISLIHVVKECPRSYTIGYLMPHRSIFLEMINKNVLRFLEAGLITKWFNDAMDIFKLQSGLKNREFIQPNTIQLTLEHLQMAFIVLAIGVGLSVIVLIVEIFGGCC